LKLDSCSKSAHIGVAKNPKCDPQDEGSRGGEGAAWETRRRRRWKFIPGSEASERTGTPRPGLSLLCRENAGDPARGGGSVTTRLSRGNYNPAAAPAYRVTSDPSKRVAWEFGRRQRPAGGRRSALRPPPGRPLSRRAGGEFVLGEGGAAQSQVRPLRVWSSTPWACHCAQRKSRWPRSLGCTALTRKTVNLISIFCNHSPPHNTHALAAPEFALRAQQ
jgi:hypothetical protein